MKSCNLAAKSSDESRFSLPLKLRMAEKRRVCGLVGGGQDWMWVARVLKRSENSGEAKSPSLRTVSHEACSVLAWSPGGTSTAVGCNYLGDRGNWKRGKCLWFVWLNRFSTSPREFNRREALSMSQKILAWHVQGYWLARKVHLVCNS